jgi:hypothetical protein
VDRLAGRGQALIAALLIALLPSNVTIGGPVFLIPVNLSLILIPIGLVFGFQLTRLKPIYNYVASLLCPLSFSTPILQLRSYSS